MDFLLPSSLFWFLVYFLPPFPIISPFAVSALTASGTVLRAFCVMPLPVGVPLHVLVPFPVRMPLPVGNPAAAPHAPVGGELLGVRWQGRYGVAGVSVRCQGVRRDALAQVNNPCGDGVPGEGSPVDCDSDTDILGRGWCMPFDPDQLAVVLWDDDVVHLVGRPQDVKSHGGGLDGFDVVPARGAARG